MVCLFKMNVYISYIYNKHKLAWHQTERNLSSAISCLMFQKGSLSSSKSLLTDSSPSDTWNRLPEIETKQTLQLPGDIQPDTDRIGAEATQSAFKQRWWQQSEAGGLFVVDLFFIVFHLLANMKHTHSALFELCYTSVSM